MIEKKQYSIEVGGKKLTLEISSLADQTNAAVLAKYGETVVLVTAVMGDKEGNFDYMPLRVDYEEKFYAAGKILGSRYMRREGRPSEDAILADRLVDRTIRPLFDERIRREIQVVATVLSFDEENEPDFVGLMGASAALAISDIPWGGPAAGVRIAKIGGKFLVNPSNREIQKPECSFEIFAAGPEGRISMIELAGKEVDEKEILSAIEIAQKEIDALVEFQKSIVKEIGKKKADVLLFEIDPKLRAAGEKFLESRLEDAFYKKTKHEYHEATTRLKKEYFSHLKEELDPLDSRSVEVLWEETVGKAIHKNILEKEKRPDFRGINDVRDLRAEVKLFERTHGSSLFVRGNTQALAVTTLAAPGAEQLVETMGTTGKRRFMLHYNFPPYSVHEIGIFRGPGRREIGHGALAEKAIINLLPTQEEFPYTIRVVSEILSSNGSSSMATVCASSLSLMDAGVPLKKQAAGIAMGLMSDEQGNYKVLTDLQGPEDHYGDMDFKVAGTDTGVTAVQLDVKTRGLTFEIIQKTFEQAKVARFLILEVMNGVLSAPREKPSAYAPAVLQLRINPDKIGAVIGPGGKMINGLIKKYELAGIDIEEDGRVFVSSLDRSRAEQAMQDIKSLTREYKVGEIIEGKVIKNLDFGAIVDLGGGKDGMIHVSELKNGFVKTVEEVVKVGDFVRAKVIRVDADGHIGLSLKQM
ncbi:MAG: polyribonucleotide nucleotidyltransferase [Candidatus Liptonbacteria bacterium]|nr:polyribonucleotide nucleotidyltransferase [Candidatus Liptonbacteria bacterium]